MKLKWVNHASFVFEYKDVKLICDPWIEGPVFNEGWRHIVKTQLSYADFKDITHIWFSHEHPDHFSPPNIKKIPADIRAQITVLYQSTIDRKVADFCRNAGFKNAIELQPLQWTRLGDNGIEILNSKIENERDSWLYVKTPELSFLNLNDCCFERSREENIADLSKIKQAIAGPVDVLFTQFSYANWVGNKQDVAFRQKCALDKRIEIAEQIEVFKPTYTVPFASYVWFCHEDNFYMNDFPNKIDETHDYINTLKTISVVLYPGDEWDMKSPLNSEHAVEKYLKSIAEVVKPDNLIKNPTITIEELKKSAEIYTQKSLSLNYEARLLQFKPFSFFLTDQQKSYSFSFKQGIQAITVAKESCDIELSTQALKYCFDHLWGFDTLFISGRFQKPVKGNFLNFQEYQYLSTLNNQGGRIGNKLDSAIKRLKQIFSK